MQLEKALKDTKDSNVNWLAATLPAGSPRLRATPWAALSSREKKGTKIKFRLILFEVS